MSFSRSLVVAVSASCLLPATALAAAPTDPVTRGELPALVKEILMNEPEMIMESVQKMREKQAAEEKQKAQEGLDKYKKDLFENAALPSAGAKDADITIVEFFDYHCGYCKHMLPVVMKTLEEDKKVRFVFIEFPILSDDSVLAGRAALAVNNIAKDKYFAYHQELMKANGKYEEKMLMDIATKVGVDAEKLKAEMAKPAITTLLDKNREMAGALKISGTPAIVFGGEISPGAVEYDALKQMIASVRAGKKPSDAFKKEEAPKN